MHATICVGGAALRSRLIPCATIGHGSRMPRSAATKQSKVGGNQEASAGSTAESCMPVQLHVHKHVEYGDAIRAVGALPELGAWEPERAPSLTWCEGDLWSGSLCLPVTEEPIKFKVRRRRAEMRDAM
jgi:Starch binding domain